MTEDGMGDEHAARFGSSRVWLERLQQGPSGRLPRGAAGPGPADKEGYPWWQGECAWRSSSPSAG